MITASQRLRRVAGFPIRISLLSTLLTLPMTCLADADLSGGLTLIGQGVSGVASDEATSGFNYSVDLQLSSDVGDGNLFIYLNTAEGADAFAGANADFEGGSLEEGGFSRTGVAEAWYQLPLSAALKLTAGKIDPTGIYDGNEVANDQTLQFLANDFVNNAAIPFPAYTVGVNAAYEFSEDLSVNAGIFEHEGIHGTMEDTFFIGELGLGWELLGGKNNIRVTYWQDDLIGSGFAVNSDQDWGAYKLFLRYGSTALDDLPAAASQEEIDAANQDVAASFSVGGNYKLGDSMLVGIAIAVDTPRDENLDARSWLEAYYSIELDENLAVALDYQNISNRDFDASADKVSVYGIRMQIGF